MRTAAVRYENCDLFSRHTGIMLVVACGFIFGCTGLRKVETISKWDALQSAAKADCAPWPMQKQDLGIYDLRLFDGEKPHFLARIMGRDAIQGWKGAPFAFDPEVNAKDVRAVQLGARPVILGGGSSAQGAFTIVANQDSGRTAQIEVRTFPDNIVRRRYQNLGITVVDGFALPVQAALWMAVKVHSSEKSIEEVPVRILHLSQSEGEAKATIKTANVPMGTEFPALLTSAKGDSAQLVWRKEKGTKSEFFYSRLGADGSYATPTPLNIPVSMQVESWAAASFGSNILLAIVDGDSLVGQASLKLVRFEPAGKSGAEVKWVKTKSLLNEHVSDPVIASGPNGAYVLLPKWLDEESTIATYRLGIEAVESQPVAGIFPKGIRLVGASISQDGKKLFAIVRSRAKVGWNFQVCRLESI